MAQGRTHLVSSQGPQSWRFSQLHKAISHSCGWEGGMLLHSKDLTFPSAIRHLDFR